MISLPPGLEPWSPWLSELLEQEAALFLGELIARLTPLLGPLKSPRNHQEGEPDGYLGVANRGSYERLLASEWALAELAPDEFLRRAASAEQLFFQRAFQEPAGSLSSSVLFDTGPDQLGECRLLHLALLIAMARRAELAHAQLRWGILQRPELGFWMIVTRESLQSLLEGRTFLEPTAEQLEAWKLQFQEEEGGPEELWVVGSPSALSLDWPQNRFCIRIEESLDAEQNALLFSLQRPNAPERKMLVELPPTRLSARILRSPFRKGAGMGMNVEARPIQEQSLIFSQNESKLLCLIASQGLLAFPVPNSPNAKPARVRKTWTEVGHRLLGASWFHRRFLMGLASESRMVVQGIGKQEGSRHPCTILERRALTDFKLHSTNDQTELRPFISQDRPGQEGFYFLDDAWHLHRWQEGAEFPHSVLSHRTLQMSWLENGGGLCFAELYWNPAQEGVANSSGAMVIQVVFGLRFFGFQVPLDERITPRVFFGHGGHYTHWVALQTGVETWQIATLIHGSPVDAQGQKISEGLVSEQERMCLPVGLKTWKVPAGSQVFGVLQRPDSLSPGLLLIEDRKVLVWSPEKGAEVLRECSAPITHACCGTRYDRVAYLTQSGEIGVYSVSWGENLLRAFLEASS